jgi:CheY-like chemotaxis protein
MTDRYGPGRLVALADDDVVQTEIVSDWLQMLGYRVVGFPTGDALMAWAMTSAVRPSAVLLDVEMPGSDGFTVCRSLREIPSFSSVRVACVSSLEEDLLERGALAAGADVSLRKDDRLLPRLAQWLTAA